MQGLGKTVQVLAFLAALLGKKGDPAKDRVPAWESALPGAQRYGTG